MQTLLGILQFVLPIVLILLVLSQNRSVGLGAGFGGETSFQAVRRGPEKVLYQGTIIVSILLAVVTLASSIIQN